MDVAPLPKTTRSLFVVTAVAARRRGAGGADRAPAVALSFSPLFHSRRCAADGQISSGSLTCRAARPGCSCRVGAGLQRAPRRPRPAVRAVTRAPPFCNTPQQHDISQSQKPTTRQRHPSRKHENTASSRLTNFASPARRRKTYFVDTRGRLLWEPRPRAALTDADTDAPSVDVTAEMAARSSTQSSRTLRPAQPNPT